MLKFLYCCVALFFSTTSFAAQAVQVTFGSTNYSPVLTPDGRQIVFLSDRDAEENKSIRQFNNLASIYSVNVDGTNLRKLVPAVSQDRLSVSPDGTKIVFTINTGIHENGEDHFHAIFIANIDGSGVTQLTPNEWYYRQPEFSPDGARIVFGGIDQDMESKIFSMALDGSDLRKHTEATRSYRPAYSADGSKILFARKFIGADEHAPVGGIYSTSAGLDEFVLEEPKLLIETDVQTFATPRMTPDGSQIIFTNKSPSANRLLTFLFSMSADGNNVRQLTCGKVKDDYPSLSRDGKTIVFARRVSSRAMDIYLLPIEGENCHAPAPRPAPVPQPEPHKPGRRGN